MAGPSGDVWAGIAGDVGRSLRGSGVKWPLNRLPYGGVGKKSLLRSEEACGLDCRAQDLLDPVVADKCFLTLVIGDRDSSTGHFAGERNGLASSDCL